MSSHTNVHTNADSVDPQSAGEGTSASSSPQRSKNGTSERHLLARNIGQVEAVLVQELIEIVVTCTAEACAGRSVLELERSVAKHMMPLSQRLLAFVFAKACETAMQEDLQARGLDRSEIRLRTDAEGYLHMNTTFGPIVFPAFAYRDLSVPVGSVTRNPARRRFPYHRKCRSSPLCLEWETQLGIQHPFRKSEQMLQFFTRGASTVEDTTIARHILALSQMIEPQWLYKKPEDIRRILEQEATRDKTTERPLIYVSSDAHALKRYVGDTWAQQWKMVNGIRVWCEDATTGEIIHLGGEFTWKDCHGVAERIQELIRAGILPNEDPEWTQLDAQVVFVSDGSAWLLEHLVPLLGHAIVILDPYHLIDWFAQFTDLAFGSGSKRSRELHAQLQTVLFGTSKPTSPKAPAKRRGHTKNRRPRTMHAHHRPRSQRGRPRTVCSDFTARALLNVLAEIDVTKAEHQAALESLVTRIGKNTLRIDYASYLARGLQIGSGAMESLHRTGSQVRLKLPGARWREESSQAILQFRMLELSGRWREFWDRPDITSRIAEAFEPTPSAEVTGASERKAA